MIRDRKQTIMTTTLTIIENQTIAIQGELVFSTVMDVWKKSLTLIESLTSVVIDLAKVAYCDSSSLALLIEWKHFAEKHHKTITLIHIPQQLMQIAKVANLDKILDL